jgi:hypothetical protein
MFQFKNGARISLYKYEEAGFYRQVNVKQLLKHKNGKKAVQRGRTWRKRKADHEVNVVYNLCGGRNM